MVRSAEAEGTERMSYIISVWLKPQALSRCVQCFVRSACIEIALSVSVSLSLISCWPSCMVAEPFPFFGLIR